VFLTSHDAGDVEHLCRRVIIINHGVVVFDDTVAALRQGFLRRKRIQIKLLEPARAFRLPGVDVIRHDDYELVVEVDPAVQPIEVAVAQVMAAVAIADVSIADPPLEEIIAALYQQQRAAPA
jgi:ABC-2 type transport system ATP-binding protein